MSVCLSPVPWSISEKDTGALPGTLEEKMAPYIAPFYDNLEVLFNNRKTAGDSGNLDGSSSDR